jgi:hypothetical protein
MSVFLTSQPLLSTENQGLNYFGTIFVERERERERESTIQYLKIRASRAYVSNLQAICRHFISRRDGLSIQLQHVFLNMVRLFCFHAGKIDADRCRQIDWFSVEYLFVKNDI